MLIVNVAHYFQISLNGARHRSRTGLSGTYATTHLRPFAALIASIMRGRWDPLPGCYSSHMHQLAEDMLQRGQIMDLHTVMKNTLNPNQFLHIIGIRLVCMPQSKCLC